MKTISKRKPTLSELAQEVALLRSFMIGMALKDPEGDYKPEFVEDVLKSMDEPAVGKFTTPEEFLKLLDEYGDRD